MPSRVVPCLGAVVALGGLLTACAGGGGPGDATSPTSPTSVRAQGAGTSAPASEPTSSPAPTDPLADPLDVIDSLDLPEPACSRLTAAEVAAALGKTSPLSRQDGPGYCIFSAHDGPARVHVYNRYDSAGPRTLDVYAEALGERVITLVEVEEGAAQFVVGDYGAYEEDPSFSAAASVPLGDGYGAAIELYQGPDATDGQVEQVIRRLVDVVAQQE